MFSQTFSKAILWAGLESNSGPLMFKSPSLSPVCSPLNGAQYISNMLYEKYLKLFVLSFRSVLFNSPEQRCPTFFVPRTSISQSWTGTTLRPCGGWGPLAQSTFENQKLTQGALETGTFTFQASKNTQNLKFMTSCKVCFVV